MPRTLRRLIGLFAGYALAVLCATAGCVACLSAVDAAGIGVTGGGTPSTIFAAGAAMTASTAWPGYIVTSWLLLSKRMSNRPGRLALTGALTAGQAILLVGLLTGRSGYYFSMQPELLVFWASAIMGGMLGALAFSLVAETLFNMKLNGPNRPPLPSES